VCHGGVQFYGLYAWAFGANLDEMVEEDLILFPSLQAFFSREIKPDARTIDDAALMVRALCFMAI
jgi:phosphatidylserine decarboxylase